MKRLLNSILLFGTLLGAALADSDLDRITAVRSSVEGATFKVVAEMAKRAPQASAYYLTAPDRLVIEFNDALPVAVVSGKPAAGNVKAWSLKKSALNRSTLTLTLTQRPPSSLIKISTVENPHRLVVEGSTLTGLSDKMALTQGITWVREDTLMDGGWVRLNRLLFDPADPQIEVVLGLAKERTDSREELTSMVKRYDAVAGINGGFFAGSGGALGLVYRDGKMVAPHVSRRPPRSGFGMTTDRKPLFGRLAAAGQTIKDLDGGDWSKAALALGGGPRLIMNGTPKVTSDLEELGPKGNDITRKAARSLVGLAANGQLMFATVSGYHDNHKEGTRFDSLVRWLQSLGMKEAVNFDGGASVDMVVGPHIVSDGPANASKEKPVATALLVRDKREKLYPQGAAWKFSRTTLPADGQSEADLSLSLTTPSGRPIPDGSKVRFFARGIMVSPAEAVTSGGVARVKVKSVRAPGTATITVTSGPLIDKKTVTLSGGEFERFHVEQPIGVAVKGKPDFQKATVKVLSVDQWGNPFSGEPFTCSVDGVATSEFRTDGRGMMVLDVELPAAGGVFTLHHPSGDIDYRISPLAAR